MKIERVVVGYFGENASLHFKVDGEWFCTNLNYLMGSAIHRKYPHSDADIGNIPDLVLDWKAEDKRVQQDQIEAISTQWDARSKRWITRVWFVGGSNWGSHEKPGDDW